jgi:thiol-disulfide isomerase/thioredoxin
MNRRFCLGLLLAATASFSATFAPIPSSQAADLEFGASAPNFTAEGVDGKEVSLEKNKGAKATVIAFTCNRCPVAIAYEDRFIEFSKKYAGKDVQFIAINVNSSENVEAMKQRAEEKGSISHMLTTSLVTLLALLALELLPTFLLSMPMANSPIKVPLTINKTDLLLLTWKMR